MTHGKDTEGLVELRQKVRAAVKEAMETPSPIALAQLASDADDLLDALDVAALRPAADPKAEGLAKQLPVEIAERYDRAIARIDALPEDAPNMDLLADVLELMADLSDMAREALAIPAPTELSREAQRPDVFIDGNGDSTVTADKAEVFKAAWDAVPEPPIGRKILGLYLAPPEAQSRDGVVELRAALEKIIKRARGPLITGATDDILAMARAALSKSEQTP